jgi:hypothetical protein
MLKRIILTAALLSLASAAFAQVVITRTQSGEKGPVSFERIPGPGPGPDANLFMMEMSGSDELITGAPYTATAVTETAQTLGDGNRIVRKSTASLARDGQGRTRREESFSNVGALSVEAPNVAIIRDPVAQSTYILRPGRGTVQTIKNRAANIMTLHGPAGEGEGTRELSLNGNAVIVKEKVAIDKPGPGPGAEPGIRRKIEVHGAEEPAGEVKRESLGTQVIEEIGRAHV